MEQQLDDYLIDPYINIQIRSTGHWKSTSFNINTHGLPLRHLPFPP